jgi:hypothetical protein
VLTTKRGGAHSGWRSNCRSPRRFDQRLPAQRAGRPTAVGHGGWDLAVVRHGGRVVQPPWATAAGRRRPIRVENFVKMIEINRKKIIFSGGPTWKFQVAAFFTQYHDTTRHVGLRPPNLQLRAKPPLPVHYTTHVFIFGFFSPHMSVNCFVKTLNGIK